MKKTLAILTVILSFALSFTSCSGQEHNSDIFSSATSQEMISDSEYSNASERFNTEEESSLSDESIVVSEEISEEVSFEDGEFFVLYTEGEVDFSKAPKAEISNYPWNNDYAPYAYGQIIFKKDDGFYIFMYCEESNPKTEITEIGGNVYKDSALEFFCDYKPRRFTSSVNYINLEMNSAGVYLANYGRDSILNLSKKRISVKGEVFDKYWTVTAHIPMKVLTDIYGDYEIGVGSTIKCNFTKCGSGTEIRHWGTWQPLGGDEPNFHQPKAFATVEIRK